jgi:hypothetical protein
VDRAFDDEDMYDQDVEPQGVKRKALSSAELPDGPCGQLRTRHRAWNSRRGKKTEIGAWRPRKLHRVSAKRWLTNLDNQFKQCTDTGGLSYFLKDSSSAAWAATAWARWPHLSIAMDCGSDGFCASFGLEYAWGFNIDRIPDQSHAINCDWDGALGDSQLKGFILCMMISWNLPYGPDRDHVRMSQLREAVQAGFSRTTPRTNPLFMQMSSGIIESFHRNGFDFNDDEPKEDQVWRAMAERGFGRRQGHRVSLCRFAAGLAKAVGETKWWDVDRYERTYLALETGMMSNSALLKKLRLKAGPAEAVEEGGASTSTTKLTMEDRGDLRACLANAVIRFVAIHPRADVHSPL